MTTFQPSVANVTELYRLLLNPAIVIVERPHIRKARIIACRTACSVLVDSASLKELRQDHIVGIIPWLGDREDGRLMDEYMEIDRIPWRRWEEEDHDGRYEEWERPAVVKWGDDVLVSGDEGGPYGELRDTRYRLTGVLGFRTENFHPASGNILESLQQFEVVDDVVSRIVPIPESFAPAIDKFFEWCRVASAQEIDLVRFGEGRVSAPYSGIYSLKARAA